MRPRGPAYGARGPRAPYTSPPSRPPYGGTDGIALAAPPIARSRVIVAHGVSNEGPYRPGAATAQVRLACVSTCATSSRELAEPLAGTAAATRTWLLIEQTGPWGAKALTASHLDPEVGRALERAAEGTGVRVALIRWPGRHADRRLPTRQRVFAAHPARPVVDAHDRGQRPVGAARAGLRGPGSRRRTGAPAGHPAPFRAVGAPRLAPGCPHRAGAVEPVRGRTPGLRVHQRQARPLLRPARPPTRRGTGRQRHRRLGDHPHRPATASPPPCSCCRTDTPTAGPPPTP